MTNVLTALETAYRNDRSRPSRDLVLDLAAAGVATFPLTPGKKTPAVPGGFHSATTDEAFLRRAFACRSYKDREVCPGIGIVPGSLGAVVVDIDVKKGHTGDVSYERLVGHRPEQAPLVVKSPSGGYHLWYATPYPDLGSAAGIADGLDYRSFKGYVAMHPGYELVRWDSSQGLPTLPQALKDLLPTERPAYTPAPPPAYDLTEPIREEHTDYSQAVDGMLASIPPDIGNDEWVSVCFAVAAALPAEVAEQTLITWSRPASSFNAGAVRRIRNMIDTHNRDNTRSKPSVGRLRSLATGYGWQPTAPAAGAPEWDDSDAPPEEFWEEVGFEDTAQEPASPAPKTRQKAETWGQGIEVGIEDDWWESDPVLKNIREGARSLRCAPAAVLGAVLARVSASIPPWVCVTAFLDGSPQWAQLNFFTVLVGGPGQSKTLSLATAKQLTGRANRFPDKDGIQPSSGEGILEAFMGEVMETHPDTGKKHKVRKQVSNSVLIQVDEAKQFFGTAGRTGSITMDVLRAAWSGAALGTHTGGGANTREVPADGYRLSAVIGAQPVTLGELLNDKDTGTIQRFTCFPASDPMIPDVKPAYPGELYLNWKDHCPYPPTDGKPFLVLPTPSIVEEIDRCRVAAMRGTPPPEEYNLSHIDHGEHTQLLRLRVAALWGALTNPTGWWKGLTDNDWAMAFQILMISTATQKIVRKIAAEKTESLYRAARHAHARRERCADRLVNDARAERQVETIERGVSLLVNKLRRVDGPLPHRSLKNCLGSDIKRSWRASKGEGSLISNILEMGCDEGFLRKENDGKYSLS